MLFPAPVPPISAMTTASSLSVLAQHCVFFSKKVNVTNLKSRLFLDCSFDFKAIGSVVDSAAPSSSAVVIGTYWSFGSKGFAVIVQIE